MKNAIATIILAIVTILMFGLAGECDYQDAKREQAEYCRKVKQGLWPDFRETYKKECH